MGQGERGRGDPREAWVDRRCDARRITLEKTTEATFRAALGTWKSYLKDWVL